MKGEPPVTLFWVIITVVVVWAWLSLPHIDHPLGSDWGHYFTAAEYIWDPRAGLAYPDFRKPWYGWIIGGLGQWCGYFAAAQFVGRAAMVLMVLGSALLGTAMAGRWAGIAAAVTVPLMPLVMDGALWVNHYPLLGATVGLSVGAGAAAVRWPCWRWVVLAGVMAGVSLALDLRGAIAVPMVIVLVGLGGIPLGLRQAALRLMVLGMMIGTVHSHDQWLQDRFDVPQLDFEQQLQVQRKGTLEQIKQGIFDDASLENSCAAMSVGNIEIGTLLSDCGARLAASSHRRLSLLQLIPSPNGLWWLPFTLLPLAWGVGGRLRSSLMSVVIFGAPLISVWVGMRWVTYFDRYLLPFAAILVNVVPVAVCRIAAAAGEIMPRYQRWLGWMAAAGSLAMAGWVWPGVGARSVDSPETVRSSEYHAGVLASWVSETVQDNESVVDCAGLAIDSLLLPAKIDYIRFPPGDPACVAQIQSPEKPMTYLITMHRDLPPQYRITDLPFNVMAIGALGWVPVETALPLDGYRIWSQ